MPSWKPDGGGGPALLVVTVVFPGRVTDKYVTVTGVVPVVGPVGRTVTLAPVGVLAFFRVSVAVIGATSVAPATLVSVRCTVSSASSMPSRTIETENVTLVTPAANVSVPVAGA